ncbi:hypothetical protein EI427_23620 [Flammeovirga pectinis]|uniref:Uncharacterized protein n=1 Tax=Flammeovirga pectinis TaxID=2494373 RepID=A0A3Q9FQG1_9BACT|nr:hypothetical protein [Flammeovirga pectinis]AZQ65206.1 hypothetical protein EI427_23620 [Flammeovirga pectinis]
MIRVTDTHKTILISFDLNTCWEVFRLWGIEDEEADALQQQIDVLLGHSALDESDMAFVGTECILQFLFEKHIFNVTHSKFPLEFFENTHTTVDGETCDIYINLVDHLSRSAAIGILQFIGEYDIFEVKAFVDEL